MSTNLTKKYIFNIKFSIIINMKTQEEKKKPSFLKNVLMLMFSQVLIKILGLVYRLAITNAEGFGDLGNGYYSTGYQIYAVILIITSQGIPGAISKLVSDKVAQNKYNEAHRIFKVALLVFAIIGLLGTVILFSLAEFISSSMLNVSDVKYVLTVLSPAIFFVCISAVIRGYFAGLGTMKASSTSQALEQFFNCVLTITFVYAMIGKEPYIMAAAGNISTTIAVLLSFSYLLIFYKTNIKKNRLKTKEKIDKNKDSIKKLSKVIILTAIPLTIGSVISVVTSFIDTVTVSNCIQIAYEGIINSKYLLEQEAMRLMGILSKVDTLSSLPLAVNLAFYFALIPEITSAIVKKDYVSAAKKISFSVGVSLLIVLPCAFGFISLAEPILKMFYPNASSGAYIFQISSITMIFVAINHTLQGSLFGLGKMYTPSIALLCGCLVKIILNFILVSNPNINIYGAAISSLVCQLITFVIIYIAIKRSIKFKMDIKNKIIKPLLSSLLMAIIVFTGYHILNNIFGNTISTLLSILLGAISYLLIIILFKVFNKEEINSFPMGNKIYNLLLKFKLYKEE